MKKIKTPYKNIYSVLKTNRFIVIFVVSGALVSALYSGWIVYDVHKKALNNAFAISTDGSVIHLKWVSQKENLKVEALAHLELFHAYFYNLDASNY
jgi:hypothetical protein